MADPGALSASLEDYLEAIFHIVREKKAARAKDISRLLKVTSSSVTGALHSLADKGLINYSPYDVITLTDEGHSLAEDVVRRHEALRDFFVKVLLVEPAEADDAACKMEHVIPSNILERFIQFIDFVDVCPRGGAEWVKGFGYKCKHGEQLDECERCVSLVLEGVKKLGRRSKSKPQQTLTLKDLEPGQRGRILRIRRKRAIRKRIADMGVTGGALIEVERVAPSGDAIEVKVKGYHITLSAGDAEDIVVESL